MRLNFNIPKVDILLIAGDSLGYGSIRELQKLNKWLERQSDQFKKCIVIPGNHDKCMEDNPEMSKNTLTAASLLVDEEIEFEGLRIYGTPWTPRFGRWSFMLPRGEAIREKWKMIPEGLDILMVHGPAHGILDIPGHPHNESGSVGCEELRKHLLETMKSPPKVVVHGHIHGNYIEEPVSLNGITFRNCAAVDEYYGLKSKCPVQVFEYLV